jgi:aspartate/methionine/tyrosine aminotransferase
MMGGFAAFLVANRVITGRESTLYIDPGFPVQKLQSKVLGQPYESFDVYNHRGDKLRKKLESYLQKGNISTILYSNPNNPTWMCLTDGELKTIAELADKYNAIVIEDLAYIAMDFRKDLSTPGMPPFQSTIAKYTDNYILLISSSKAFSYAGQRIGMLVISDKLFNSKFPDLRRYYATDVFGRAMIYGALYAISAGTGHSAQYALAAILHAVNTREYNFIEQVKEYGEKAKIMKRIFTEGGFKIVYDKDLDREIADGFYFTISYPGFSGAELIEALLYYGISAISLDITGSERHEGLRACVSQVGREQFEDLRERVSQFYRDHKI